MWILTAFKMLRACGSGVKILALIALLAFPSVFAYGNRPGDYEAGRQNTKNINYSPVIFWNKLPAINQARSPDVTCYEPAQNSGHFKNCQPFQSNSFPSKEAVCSCSKCDVPVKLICFAGSWYVHPDVLDFPCDNCNTLCPIQENRQFKCEDTSVGKIGDIKMGCLCLYDCLEYDIECGSNSKWTQSSFVDDNGNNILCNAERKTVVRDDKEVQYHNGLITVKCKPGYKPSSSYAISCRNGVRNGSIPECVSDYDFNSNNGGFGDFDQQHITGNSNGFDNSGFNNNPNTNFPNNNNPGFGNRPGFGNNPNSNFANNNNPHFNNNPNNNGNRDPNNNNPGFGNNFNNPNNNGHRDPNNQFPNNNNNNNPNFNNNNNPNFNNNNNPNFNNNPNNNGHRDPNNQFPNNNNNNNNPDFNNNKNPNFNNNNNPDFNNGGGDPEFSGFTTRVPKIPNNNANGVRPTSSSITSNKPVNRNFNYMYILFAVLALLAVIALVALAVTIWRCRHPAKPTDDEAGVAADDGATKPGVKGSYSAKK